MISDDRILFIVGNSRSGTTLLMRALEHHPEIFVFHELHFFEQLWAPEDKGKTLTSSEAITLFSKLLRAQRLGYMTHDLDYSKFKNESIEILSAYKASELTGEAIYSIMMKHEVALNKKSIACEKTPQNVFYLNEIFDLFPNARVINMVRDPRAIMLSQKNKWKRPKLGSDYMPKKEALRLRINYHPITISKLWNAAIDAAKKYETDSRMLTVRFEDLLENPQQILQMVCTHIGVEFIQNMLEVKQESSSNEADSHERGFKKERAANWKKGGLNKAEIWWNEKICGHHITHYQFPLEKPNAGLLQITAYLLSFPFKIALALLFNLDRMKNMMETLKRRI